MAPYSQTGEGSSISGHGRDYPLHHFAPSRSSSLDRHWDRPSQPTISLSINQKQDVRTRRGRSVSKGSRPSDLYSRTRIWKRCINVSRSRSPSLRPSRPQRPSQSRSRSRSRNRDHSPNRRRARSYGRSYSRSRNRSRSSRSDRRLFRSHQPGRPDHSRNRSRTLSQPILPPTVVKGSRETTVTKYSVTPRREILPYHHHHHHHRHHNHLHHQHHYKPESHITYIRVSVRDVYPETLNHFGYPWERSALSLRL